MAYHTETNVNIAAFDEVNSLMYLVPASTIQRTKGSQMFLSTYEPQRPLSKTRFGVCRSFLQHCVCEHGENCNNIHVPSTASPTTVHINKRESFATYNKAPPGMKLIIRPAGRASGELEVKSDDLLFTRGSASYVDHVEATGSPPPYLLRLCSHFQDDLLCPFGKRCNFLHAIGGCTVRLADSRRGTGFAAMQQKMMEANTAHRMPRMPQQQLPVQMNPAPMMMGAQPQFAQMLPPQQQQQQQQQHMNWVGQQPAMPNQFMQMAPQQFVTLPPGQMLQGGQNPQGAGQQPVQYIILQVPPSQ